MPLGAVLLVGTYGFMSHWYHHATIMWTVIVFKDGWSLCFFSFQRPTGSVILRIRNAKTASEECMCRSLHVSCDAAAAEVLSCLCAAGRWGWTEWRLNALCLISCDLWWECGKLLANSWLSYPGGLIIFNPVDELRPDLHCTQEDNRCPSSQTPNQLSSLIRYHSFSSAPENAFMGRSQRGFLHREKKKKVWCFCKHSTKRGDALSTSLLSHPPFYYLPKLFPVTPS